MERPMTIEYLSMTEVAERLGITKGALARYRLPEPDVMVGKARGWLPETIDQWNAQRPGRGVGGGRPRKNKGNE
jgi:predicted DNA-binding transcriptional regulator AlpA